MHARKIIRLYDEAKKYLAVPGNIIFHNLINEIILCEEYKKLKSLFNKRIQFKGRSLIAKLGEPLNCINDYTFNILGHAFSLFFKEQKFNIRNQHCKHFTATMLANMTQSIFVGYDQKGCTQYHAELLSDILSSDGYSVNIGHKPITESFASFMAEQEKFLSSIYISNRKNKYIAITLFHEDGCRIDEQFIDEINHCINQTEYCAIEKKYPLCRINLSIFEGEFIQYWPGRFIKAIEEFFENSQSKRQNHIIIDLQNGPMKETCIKAIDFYRLETVFSFYPGPLCNFSNIDKERSSLKEYAESKNADYIFIISPNGKSLRILGKEKNKWKSISIDDTISALITYIRDVMFLNDVLILHTFDVSNFGVVAALYYQYKYNRIDSFENNCTSLICKYRNQRKANPFNIVYNQRGEYLIHQGRSPSALHFFIVLGCFCQFIAIDIAIEITRCTLGNYKIVRKKFNNIKYQEFKDHLINYCINYEKHYQVYKSSFIISLGKNINLIFFKRLNRMRLNAYIDGPGTKQSKKFIEHIIETIFRFNSKKMHLYLKRTSLKVI